MSDYIGSTTALLKYTTDGRRPEATSSRRRAASCTRCTRRRRTRSSSRGRPRATALATSAPSCGLQHARRRSISRCAISPPRLEMAPELRERARPDRSHAGPQLSSPRDARFTARGRGRASGRTSLGLRQRADVAPPPLGVDGLRLPGRRRRPGRAGRRPRSPARS